MFSESIPLITQNASWQSTKQPCIQQVYRRLYGETTIFNMVDGIITPCNVARSWHWFRQVTAPCNVACGSGIMTVNSPSGSTLQCHTWLCDAILDFRVPIMGSLKSPSRTSYRSSIDTMALHCLVFEKIAFLYFSDKQTDEQTNRWTAPMH